MKSLKQSHSSNIRAQIVNGKMKLDHLIEIIQYILTIALDMHLVIKKRNFKFVRYMKISFIIFIFFKEGDLIKIAGNNLKSLKPKIREKVITTAIHEVKTKNQIPFTEAIQLINEIAQILTLVESLIIQLRRTFNQKEN